MWRQHAAAALLFVFLAVAMTWPLALNLDRAVSDPGDPYINTWILDWDYYATFHKPLSLFHANTFHPAKYALAYSENLYGIAVLLFPLRAAGVGALTAYNLAMLAGFAFCGFAAYLLGSHLTGSWAAGVAAGIFYAFVPFRFVHTAHLQHVWGGWLPLLLLALLLYAQRPTRRRAIAFAAVFVMNGLTNIHYLLFGAFAAGVTAALLLPRSKWRELAFAMAGALLILAPFLYPYAVVAKLYGMQRGWEEVARFSATPTDWLPWQTEAERKLYPGALAYAVSALALFLARRRMAEMTLALLWIAIGFLGSLGLNFVLHAFLFGGVPGFRAIRVPARWAVIAYIGMSILIALLTAAIARRNRWLALVVPIAFAIHLFPGPIRWYLGDPRTPEVYTWLATQEVRGVVSLPMDFFSSDYEYMLHATEHHKPIANGVSGFAPPMRIELSRLSNEEPISDALIDKLREAEIDLVIVHGDKVGTGERMRAWLRRELERGRLAFAGDFHSLVYGDWAFRVAPEGAAARPMPPQLQAYLRGEPTCASDVMGLLDTFPGSDHYTGDAWFAGWVVSPHGIKRVDLMFGNRTYRHPAALIADASLNARCAGKPNITRVRLIGQFAKRPREVRPDTDVHVEVTDGRGRKTVFGNRWIRWD
ncbi:MAG TPA: hypothetical protein VE010_11325 [Thermoanaerobaculia bacterium]|nr:hypothetical protein [Thermoanaerobaculia bacterium]